MVKKLPSKKKRGRKSKRRVPGNSKQSNAGVAPGPLTPSGKTGPPGHTEATQQTTKAVRQARAVDYYVMQRLSMAQIAKQLTGEGMPCTAKTVCKDIQEAVEAAREHRDAAIDHYRSVEAMRLDQLDRQLIPIAYDQLPAGAVRIVGKGKNAKRFEIPIAGADRIRLRLAAVGELRRNSESRRKLFGWDQQPTIGISEEQVASLVRGLTQDLLALQLIRENDDLRVAIGDVLKRRGGMLAAGSSSTSDDGPQDDQDAAIEHPPQESVS